jgi:hypothetical protein
MLTLAQQAAREGKLTASRVACLMTDDQEKILNLYYELTNDPRFVEPDLSWVWPVQMGIVTEPVNIRWFERKHGKVSMQGQVVERGPWAAATLDGFADEHSCPIECKWTGGREPINTVISRYQPQLHWLMLVTDATQCAISIIMGANEPVVEFVDKDEDYAKELWLRAQTFMLCVQTRTPPVAAAPVGAPIKAVKTYDMTSSNSWASEAFVWLENKDAAKVAQSSEKAIKALVPADAHLCTGHGIQVLRNRGGALSLRELST